MKNLRQQLEESHKDLHQWFLMHQECLLLQRDDEALQAWQVFADYLQQHIHFENTHVLPWLQAGSLPLRWGVPVYTKEHDKLGKLAGDIAQALGHYRQWQGREKRLGLLALLDRQQSLYHVMEHHEEREEQDLFNHLDLLDAETGAEWGRINVELSRRHDHLREQLKAMLSVA